MKTPRNWTSLPFSENISNLQAILSDFIPSTKIIPNPQNSLNPPIPVPILNVKQFFFLNLYFFQYALIKRYLCIK
jgi:hypothetical protein